MTEHGFRSPIELLDPFKQTFVSVPKLQPLMSHWPQKAVINSHQFQENARSNIPPRPRSAREIDSSLLAVLWWPNTSNERLDVLASLLSWLVALDSGMSRTPASVSAFRRDAIAYVHAVLFEDEEMVDSIASNPAIATFKSIGQAISRSYGREQLTLLYRELESFIDATAQRYDSSNGVTSLSLESLLRQKMILSATGICLVLIEYAYGISLPQETKKSKAMQNLRSQTSTIISMTNGILSVKKDPQAQNQDDELVSLLYNQHGILQLALDHAWIILRNAVASFETSAQILMRAQGGNEDGERVIRAFVETCMHACTANLSLASA